MASLHRFRYMLKDCGRRELLRAIRELGRSREKAASSALVAELESLGVFV
jgi:hypothetical protein